MSPYPGILGALWILGFAIFLYRYIPFRIVRAAAKPAAPGLKHDRRKS